MYDSCSEIRGRCSNCGSVNLALNSSNINGKITLNVYRCVNCGKEKIVEKEIIKSNAINTIKSTIDKLKGEIK